MLGTKRYGKVGGWTRVGRRLEWKFCGNGSDSEICGQAKLTREDGWWQLRYEIYRENGGEPRLLKGGFSTRPEREKLEELLYKKMKQISEEFYKLPTF